MVTLAQAIGFEKFLKEEFHYQPRVGFVPFYDTRRAQEWHSFVAAFVMGYFVFGDNNAVNMQINLYLLSRITVGLAKLAVDNEVIPQP
ncbi:hypothetical protein TELCIR_22082, partial [Teladorsagia circumcincta]